jgi:prepilin-type processing-associated H-X9-DG protein
VSLAFLIWVEDSKTIKFPWQVASPTGTLHHAESSQVFRHFIAVSNKLQNPRRLLCPADKARKPSASWDALQNENISYFINLASPQNWELESMQNLIILGDRNLSTNHNILSGYYTISDPTQLRWTKDIHQHRGNVALADGSVHRESIIDVQSRLTNLPVRLAIP